MATWVLEETNKLLLHFRDDLGKHSTMAFNISNLETDPLSGAADAISSKAQACSDAALYATEILITALNTDDPVYNSTPYADPREKVYFEFGNDVDGEITRMTIGAPLASVFADAYNVNPLVSPVSDFLDTLFLNAKSEGNSPLKHFRKGYRRRASRLKSR